MIEPTVGRVVLYYPVEGDPGFAPNRVLPAIICDVLSPHMVNLVCFSARGHPFARENVHLGENSGPGLASWMKYQLGQAAKTEEVAESTLSALDEVVERVNKLENALAKLASGLPQAVEGPANTLMERVALLERYVKALQAGLGVEP